MTVTDIRPDLEPRDVVPSVALVDASGISYRQLDHWTRARYLHALPRAPRATSGTPREYPRTEIPVACLMARLVDAGLQPQMASFYARQLLDTGTTRIAGIALHLPDQEGTPA